MLLVLVPVADVLASVGVPINAEALGHVINELSLVEIATGVVQLSPSIIEVVLPESLVNSAIGPIHDSVALLDILAVLQHLASVDSAVV